MSGQVSHLISVDNRARCSVTEDRTEDRERPTNKHQLKVAAGKAWEAAFGEVSEISETH